jgi:long-chain fatty acid transport protein
MPRRISIPHRLLSLTVIAAALLATANPHDALASNGAQPIAYGAKQAGRGGAEIGVAEDAISGATNPATLIDLPRIRLDGGLQWWISRYRYVNERNDELAQSFDTVVPVIGVSWDPIGPDPAAGELDAPTAALGSSIRLGLELFVPLGGGGEDELKTEVYPEGETEQTSFFTLALAPTIAWRLTDKLSVGAAVHLYYTSIGTEGLAGSTSGNTNGLVFIYRRPDGTPTMEPVIVGGQQVHYSEFFEQANTEDPTQSSRVEIDSLTGFGFGGSLGLFFQPIEEVSVGLTYRFEGRVPKLRGKAKLDSTRAFAAAGEDGDFGAFGAALLETYLPDGGQKGYQSKYDVELENFRVPAVLGVGLGLRPTPDYLLSMDFKWIRWSTAFNEYKVTLTDGTNNDINAVNGSDDLHNDKLLKWHDQFVFAMGSAARVADWMVLRGGFNYGKNPIPRSTAGITTGHTEVNLSFGAGFLIDDFDIDFAYVYAPPSSITIEKSRVNPDLNGTKVRAEQHTLYIQGGISF